MYEKPQLEIPEAVRQMTERNLDQARSSYNQFMEMARKAQDLMSRSSGVMGSTSSSGCCASPSRTWKPASSLRASSLAPAT